MANWQAYELRMRASDTIEANTRSVSGGIAGSDWRPALFARPSHFARRLLTNHPQKVRDSSEGRPSRSPKPAFLRVGPTAHSSLTADPKAEMGNALGSACGCTA